MKKLPLQGRTLALLAVIIPLLVLFIYVGLRSGPLAPVAVTVASVESQAITPALFGIGTVEARYTYKIGPTFAGRVKRLEVHVGDQVKAGQVLGEMEPVDLDDRVRSQESVFKRAEAALREAEARQAYAQTQARRYEQLFAVRSTSEEIVTTKRQELQIADAALSAAREDIARARSDREALVAQQEQSAPDRAGRRCSRRARCRSRHDHRRGPGRGGSDRPQEFVDQCALRPDQRIGAGWGAAGSYRPAFAWWPDLEGRVLRVEPKADAVTEETLAKVTFDNKPEPLPPVGELAEVTVDLPALPAAPLIPNAAVQREGDKVGVWQIVDGDLHFSPVKLGTSDLNGYVQVREGLKNGDQVVTYSEKALTARSRIHVVEHIPGVSR